MAARTQHVKFDVVQRSHGQNAVKISAYCAAARMRGEDRIYNFTRKKSEHAGHAMLLPDNAPVWATTAESLWQRAEQFEKKSNSQTARIVEIEIPRAVPAEDRLALLRHVAEPFRAAGMVVQLDVHVPLASDGGEQPHGHLVLTTREISGDDFAKKKTLGLEWNRWFQQDKGRVVHQLISDRTNEWMASRGIDHRVTHMGHAAQGITTPPEPDAPKMAVETWKSQPDHPAAEPFRTVLAERPTRQRLRAAQRAATALGGGERPPSTPPTHEPPRLDAALHVLEERIPGARPPGRRRGAPRPPWSSEWTPPVGASHFAGCEIRGRTALLSLAGGGAIFDRGDSLIMRGRISDEALSAMAAQAVRHGWKEVELTGDAAFRDRLAAAMQSRGITTTNHGKASMMARRQAEKIIAAERRASEPQPVPAAPKPATVRQTTTPQPRPATPAPEPMRGYVPALRPAWATGPRRPEDVRRK